MAGKGFDRLDICGRGPRVMSGQLSQLAAAGEGVKSVTGENERRAG